MAAKKYHDPLLAYGDSFDHTVCGIPAMIGVGRSRSDLEWCVLDRRGRPAPWLERKLSKFERAEIVEAILRRQERRR